MLERAFQPSGPNSEHTTHYRQKQRLRARQTIERDFNNWLLNAQLAARIKTLCAKGQTDEPDNLILRS